MKPPRRWTVWLVVLVMGVGWASRPCHALTAPDRKLVIPIEAPEEQSGEPDTPTGPGQLRCVEVWESSLAPSFVAARGALLAVLLARVSTVIVLPMPRQKQGERQ